MTCIAVVGAGEMGRAALRILATELPEARFAAIDRSEESLAASEALSPGRVQGVQLDISRDAPDLAGVDLVMNFAGPFYVGSDAVARAALRAGCAYLDICDDIEGIGPIFALDEEARAAGVPLVTGGGLSPGISNLLAGRILELRPECDGIRIVWVVRDSDPGGLAPLRHLLHMGVMPSPAWQDGRLVETPGFVPETARGHDFPSPLGRVIAYDTAHPEPITLSRAFPDLRHASCQGAILPVWANQIFSGLGRIGFGDRDLRVDFDGNDVDPAEFLWRMLWARHRKRHSGESPPGLTAVQAQGLVGEEVAMTMTLVDPHSMVRSTALGAAAGALAMLDERPPAGAFGFEVLHPESTLGIVEKLAATLGAWPDGLIVSDHASSRA